MAIIVMAWQEVLINQYITMIIYVINTAFDFKILRSACADSEPLLKSKSEVRL